MNPLERQIARIEEKINTRPGGTTTLWIAELMRTPGENEEALDAATFLIQEGLLDQPEPHLWARLAARFEGDHTQWPDQRLWFKAATFEPEQSIFDDEHGQEVLCSLALIYLDTFARAPLPLDKRVQVARREKLDTLFLRPLLGRACPQLDTYSTSTHRAWLQGVLDAPAGAEPESLLPALRSYVHDLTDKAAQDTSA